MCINVTNVLMQECVDSAVDNTNYHRNADLLPKTSGFTQLASHVFLVHPSFSGQLEKVPRSSLCNYIHPLRQHMCNL